MRATENLCYKQIQPDLRRAEFVFTYLDVKQTPDMTCRNHHNQVDKPNEPTAENTDDAGNNLTLGKARNHTEYPRRKGNNSQNDADYSAKTEVIFLSTCHFQFSFFVCLYYYYYII